MTAKSRLHFIGWLALVYLAAVVQTVWCTDEGPQCLWGVGAYLLCRYPSSRGVLCVGLMGLLMDAAGNDRLGWHLSVGGVLAGLAVPVLAHGRSPLWCRRMGIAAWLAFGDAITSATVSSGITMPQTIVVSEAALVAVSTAALVAGIELLATIGRRCLFPTTGVANVQLHNRWNRLVEA